LKLLITTQYLENYGAHDWDGEGECPQYWKAKGGEDYFILGVDPLREAPGLIVEAVRGEIEYRSDYSEQYILDWQLVADDYQTEFERSQLEYDGAVTYPAKIIERASA
jgi:hypothetical protein